MNLGSALDALLALSCLSGSTKWTWVTALARFLWPDCLGARASHGTLSLSSKYPEHVVNTPQLFTNKIWSLDKRRGSVVAVCSSVCDPQEGVFANGGKVLLTTARLSPQLWVDGQQSAE